MAASNSESAGFKQTGAKILSTSDHAAALKAKEQGKQTIASETKESVLDWNLDNVRLVWNQFMEEHGKSPVAFLQNKPLSIESNNSFVFEVNTLAEESLYESLRVKFLAICRNKFGNPKLEIRCILKPVSIEKPKAYTTQDKIKTLSESYPELQNLIERLKLKPE
ncbi:MAG: hypothetical protein EAZ57_07095 [Cytophagales bacterium]|nr:MAG: hypothetical protein EAZ67_07905 [Cytophagales bacterium]TAF60467.1 MAG: hypothetical protein EAZ57_07095 [Cytophagales bacterium]